MTPRQLLERFLTLTPTFGVYWSSPSNYSLNDNGSFSLHGLCTEYSDFFRRNYSDLDANAIAELFEFIELHMVAPCDPETDIDNALSTCFLENISSEPCGEFAKTLMGTKTRIFFDNLHTGPPY